MKNRFLYLSFLITLIILFLFLYYRGIFNYVSLTFVNNYRAALLTFIQHHYLAAVLLFMMLYAISIALLLPTAASFSLIGGFLFGAFPGMLYSTLSATLGALGSFFIIRFFIGSWLQKKYARQLKTFNREFEQNGLYYILSLRLIALMPFFLVNILAALTKMSPFTFLWTTYIGIIPGSFVYALAGQQLQTIRHIRDIVTLPVIIIFSLLAFFALLPVMYKKIKQIWL